MEVGVSDFIDIGHQVCLLLSGYDFSSLYHHLL